MACRQRQRRPWPASPLAPTPLAITEASTRTDEGQAVAHPVIVALTLAGDTARGAEIVRDWGSMTTPGEGEVVSLSGPAGEQTTPDRPQRR